MLNNRKTREIRFNALDFSCGSLVKVLSVKNNLAGNLTDRFRNYSRKINRKMIEYSFRQTPFLKESPEAMIDHYAGFGYNRLH